MPIQITWVGLITLIAVLALMGFTMHLSGLIDPYCHPPDHPSEFYPECQPCRLNYTVFGVYDVSACSNPFKLLFLILIASAKIVVAVPAMLLYALVEPLASIHKSAPRWILGIAAALFFSWRIRKNLKRGLSKRAWFHRTSWMTILVLSLILALSWGP